MTCVLYINDLLFVSDYQHCSAENEIPSPYTAWSSSVGSELAFNGACCHGGNDVDDYVMNLVVVMQVSSCMCNTGV